MWKFSRDYQVRGLREMLIPGKLVFLIHEVDFCGVACAFSVFSVLCETHVLCVATPSL